MQHDGKCQHQRRGQARSRALGGHAFRGRRAVAHADGQAFGDVVQGHGRDQQDAAPPAGGNALGRVLQHMDVRQHAVQTPEKGRAQQKTEHNGHKSQTAQMRSELKRGLQQTEKGRGQHHAPGPAQQAIHGPAREFAPGEDERRAQAYGQPGKQPGHQGLENGMGSNRHGFPLNVRPRAGSSVSAVGRIFFPTECILEHSGGCS